MTKPIVVVNLNDIPSECNLDKLLQELKDEGYYPVTAIDENAITTVVQSELRDQFAMAALQGWLASFGPRETVEDFDMLAEFAYKIADAMLKARSNRVSRWIPSLGETNET